MYLGLSVYLFVCTCIQNPCLKVLICTKQCNPSKYSVCTWYAHPLGQSLSDDSNVDQFVGGHDHELLTPRRGHGVSLTHVVYFVLFQIDCSQYMADIDLPPGMPQYKPVNHHGRHHHNIVLNLISHFHLSKRRLPFTSSHPSLLYHSYKPGVATKMKTI